MMRLHKGDFVASMPLDGFVLSPKKYYNSMCTARQVVTKDKHTNKRQDKDNNQINVEVLPVTKVGIELFKQRKTTYIMGKKDFITNAIYRIKHENSGKLDDTIRCHVLEHRKCCDK